MSKTPPKETLDDMFEDVAAEQGKRADALDNDPAYQARSKARRDAEVQRQIAAGLRDENGDWIEDEEGDEE